MCGLAGYFVKNPDAIRHGSLEKLTDGLLYGIQLRGWDACGYAAFPRDDWSNPRVDKMQGDAREFIAFRANLPVNPKTVLLHTRFATQGSEVFDRNNHPVRYGSVLTVHNGVIWNDASVFSKLGLRRKAEVDSEAISASLFLHGFDKAKKALGELMGSFAIASAWTTKPDKVLLARGHDSPLAVHESENLIVWASTPEAIITGWSYGIGTPPDSEKIRVIPEGKILNVSQEGIRRENFSVARSYTRYIDYEYTPAWKTERKALPAGNSELYDYRKPETPKTYLACNSCRELQPWDKMVSGRDGFMICSDCALYGESFKPYQAQCEFCGSSKNLTEEMGMPVCEPCMDQLLSPGC